MIDAVSETPQPVAAEIAKYLGTDLLCYRADAPASLVEKQSQAWDPVLAWAQEQLGARFVLAQGVVYVPQPHEVLAAAREAIPAEPWRLGAMSSITTLNSSGLLALAITHDALTRKQGAAAHVDEDWQMSQWGRDELALKRRAYRRSEFDAAAMVLQVLQAPSF